MEVQQIVTQLTKAKTELYRVRVMLLCINHKEHKEEAMRMFKELYDAFDRFQEWVGSR